MALSATSFKADHGSVKSNVSLRSTNGTEVPTGPGRSHQMLRYLINDTSTCSGRPVTETLQDPSHVPGARDRIDLDNPLYRALSHDNYRESTPPYSNSLLAKIGAQFSNYQPGTARPAKLDLADVASTVS